MPLQDPKHPANAQVTYARIYGALVIAILISTFMYGVSLVSLSLLCRIPAVMSDHTVTPVDRSILQAGGKERYESNTTADFIGHQLYDTFIISTGNPALMDRIPLQFRAVDKLTAGNRENMHALTLPHSLFNYFSPAEFGQQESSQSSTPYGGSDYFIGFNPNGAISKTFSGLKSSKDVLIEATTLQGATTAACDILISISLCYVFHSYRSGIKRTDSLINHMIIYAINRGIVTSICALLGVFLYYFVPYTYYFLIPMFVNGHLYVVSAVSILTSREGLREEINQSFHLSDLYTNTSRSDTTKGRQNFRSDFTEDKDHQTV
ncbi:hypothetical protein M422DRAFT_270727 [Sphaerobolus stellatus SS14]|uniref:DUF6534 domain-containing protein n=1 Tax=Sphaerobolus stellatus (strain SS14) TaxID=990650 RepID=A0A0C9TFC9_SPHS4|nr:hypothetical protein M422DRAFT_270727 [Sphaerobolus stellatus SS14]